MGIINLKYEDVEELKAALTQEQNTLQAIWPQGKKMIQDFEGNIFVGSLGSQFTLWATTIFVTMEGLDQRVGNSIKLLGEALEEMRLADQNLKNSIPR